MASEVTRLKQRLRELEKKVIENEQQQEASEKALAHWEEACRQATAERDAARAALEARSGDGSTDPRAELQRANAEVAAMTKRLAKVGEASKFEKLAHDGQVKRIRIMEHEARTQKADVQTLTEQKATLASQCSELRRLWEHERSLRLQDLHRNDALASETRAAGQRANEAENVLAGSHDDLKALERQVKLRDVELAAQRRVGRAQLGQIAAHTQEMELLHHEMLRLKRMALSMGGRLSRGGAECRDLQAELHCARKELLSRATTQSERQCVFSRGRDAPGARGGGGGGGNLGSLADWGTSVASPFASAFVEAGPAGDVAAGNTDVAGTAAAGRGSRPSTRAVSPPTRSRGGGWGISRTGGLEGSRCGDRTDSAGAGSGGGSRTGGGGGTGLCDVVHEGSVLRDGFDCELAFATAIKPADEARRRAAALRAMAASTGSLPPQSRGSGANTLAKDIWGPYVPEAAVAARREELQTASVLYISKDRGHHYAVAGLKPRLATLADAGLLGGAGGYGSFGIGGGTEMLWPPRQLHFALSQASRTPRRARKG